MSASARLSCTTASDAVSSRLMLRRSAAVTATPGTRYFSLRTTAVLQQAKGGGGGGKGKGGPAAAAAPVENFDLKKQIPVNILKEGPEPEYQSDDKYPEWLFELLKEKPPVEDLMMKGIEKLTPDEMKTIIRTVSKRRIKDRNMTTAKAGEE